MLLWFCLAGSLPIHAQQNPVSLPMPWVGVPTAIHAASANSATRVAALKVEPNSSASAKPPWQITRDLTSGINQRTQAQRDLAVGDSIRLGLLVGRSLRYNTLPESSGGVEQIRDARLISQWRPSEALKVDGVFGFSQVGVSIGAGGQAPRQAVMPIMQLQAHLTPRGDLVKIDLGFNRYVYDLTPQLVANPAIRNDFVIHPEIHLPSGWEVRALAEMAEATSAGGSNARYNSELTLAHDLGKASEIRADFGSLRNALAGNTAYYSPARVQNLAGGWTT
ncbi:MAG: hypothetical protein ACRD3Q_12695, partial [Terriglobales bacterium]